MDTSTLRKQGGVSVSIPLGPNPSPSFPLCAVRQAILTVGIFNLFGSAHSADGISCIVTCSPCAKSSVCRTITWHSLRHCHATLLDAVGAPLGTVQALLGHASSEVTRQIYLHAIPAEQRRAVEGVEKLLIGPKWTQVAGVAQRPN